MNLPNFNTSSIGLCLQWYLMASYLYYVQDKTLMPDSLYDVLARRLLREYESLEHRHKYLVNKEDLEAGTLFGLHELDYPKQVRSAAMLALSRISTSLNV